MQFSVIWRTFLESIVVFQEQIRPQFASHSRQALAPPPQIPTQIASLPSELSPTPLHPKASALEATKLEHCTHLPHSARSHVRKLVAVSYSGRPRHPTEHPTSSRPSADKRNVCGCLQIEALRPYSAFTWTTCDHIIIVVVRARETRSLFVRTGFEATGRLSLRPLCGIIREPIP